MKFLIALIVVLALLLFASPAFGQFLPPGVPHPDNAAEDVMADHVLDGTTIHVVWASNFDYTGSAGSDPDIFYIRFDDGSWSAPVLVNSYGELDNGLGSIDEKPRLALGSDGVLHAVWQSQYPLGNLITDLDVFYSRLAPGGGWAAVESVSSENTPDIEPNLITRSNGDAMVVWQQPFAGEQQLVSSIRTSMGWTPAAVLPSASGGPGSEYGPAALARAEDGAIVAAFSSTRDLLAGVGGDRDIAYSTFPPSGGWTHMAVVSDNAIGDIGDDRDPAVAVLGSGATGDLEIHVAWASTNDLMVNGNSTGADGDILAAVIRVALLPGAAFVVNSNAFDDAQADGKPTLCVEPGGVVHAAWQTRDAFFGDLDLLHSTNATPGGAWSPFDLLSVNALGPDGDDQGADIECGVGGILSGIWQSTHDLGGTVGPDQDLFHALGLGRVVSRPEPVNNTAPGDTNDYDFLVDFAIGPDDTLHAVWVSNNPTIGQVFSGSDADIWYARRETGGWTTPQLVNTTGTSDSDSDFEPSIIVGLDGRVHVVWSSAENIGGDTGTDYDIFYSQLVADTWTLPELVNSQGRIDTSSDFIPQITVASQDGVQVAWQSRCCPPVDLTEISWSQRTTSGWLPAETASGAAAPGFAASELGLLADPSGVAHLVWPSNAGSGGTGTDYDLFYANRTGGGWSSPELVNTWGTMDADTLETQFAPTRHNNGDLQVVWTSAIDFAGAGTDVDLFITTRTNGIWSDPDLLLDTFTTDTGGDNSPFTVLVGNTLHVAWTSTSNLGANGDAGYDIFYAPVNLTAPVPGNALIGLANPAGFADESWGETLTTLVLGSKGDLHFGFESYDDFGGTLGNDGDVLHTWLQVRGPLIFADGFEADTSMAPGSSP